MTNAREIAKDPATGVSVASLRETAVVVQRTASGSSSYSVSSGVLIAAAEDYGYVVSASTPLGVRWTPSYSNHEPLPVE